MVLGHTKRFNRTQSDDRNIIRVPIGPTHHIIIVYISISCEDRATGPR